MKDKSIRLLQSSLPWGSHEYSEQFNARTDAGRDATHAFIHVAKALGKLADPVDGFEHPGGDPDADRRDASKRLADLVICAARLANTWPGGPIDLQDAIAQRLAEKFPPKDGG